MKRKRSEYLAEEIQMNIGDIFEIVNSEWESYGALYSIYAVYEESVDLLLVFNPDSREDLNFLSTEYPIAWLLEDNWRKVDSMV